MCHGATIAESKPVSPDGEVAKCWISFNSLLLQEPPADTGSDLKRSRSRITFLCWKSVHYSRALDCWSREKKIKKNHSGSNKVLTVESPEVARSGCWEKSHEAASKPRQPWFLGLTRRFFSQRNDTIMEKKKMRGLESREGALNWMKPSRCRASPAVLGSGKSLQDRFLI